MSARSAPAGAWGRVAAVAILAVAFGACGSTGPGPATPLPPLQPAALTGPAEGGPRGFVAAAVPLRGGDEPTGPELRDDLGHPLTLDPGRLVVPVGDPAPGPGGTWVRVWVAPGQSVWPGDYTAWIPTSEGGRPTIQDLAPAPCPRLATIGALATLLPPDRLRCAGSAEITVDARSWLPETIPSYDVDPAWYGTSADPAGTTSLFAASDPPFGPGAVTNADEAVGGMDARVPPGVPRLPVGVLVRVTGRFDDPSAAGCRRSLANGGASIGLPAEPVADSVRWCREQFVVSGWQVVLGSEGRPFDPNDPQLHRDETRLAPGAVEDCAGVGMPPLTVRIDPSQPEPVWIETPGGGRSVAIFGAAFHLATDPLRVQATNGAALADGEVIDPDRGKPGIVVCPGGEVVSFDVPGA